MTEVLNFKVYPDKDHLYKYPFFPPQFVFWIVYYLGLKGMNWSLTLGNNRKQGTDIWYS